MRRRPILLFALAAMLVVQGCGDTPRQFNPLPSALGDIRGIAIGFERLQPLGTGSVYALWDGRQLLRYGSDGSGPENTTVPSRSRIAAPESIRLGWCNNAAPIPNKAKA